jgi:SAM-dependent methyltransferase
VVRAVPVVYKDVVQDPRKSSLDASALRESLNRRLHRRTAAEGRIVLPAVPSALDEYVEMFKAIFAGVGVFHTERESAQLRSVVETELKKADRASSRSVVAIDFHFPFGMVLNYRVKAESLPVDDDSEQWAALRAPAAVRTEPDARVCALADEVTDPAAHPVLDIAAGQGRNALTLARRGHPVDAVEMNPEFADTIRTDAAGEALNVRVIEQDPFAALEGVESQYGLVVASGLVPDFRNAAQVAELFDLAARVLAPGGRLVLDTFLTKQGYTPDGLARELAQICHSMMFTRDEIAGALGEQPLQLIADDSAYEFEKAHLPADAWPPTAWFEAWSRGLDVFDIEPEESPIELRWLVYRKGS